MLKFQDLYESYAPDVYRFALWLAGDRFEAEDITSETFIRAWARNSTIRTETLKAYLFTIARNVYLEQRRKRKRQVALNDDHPDPAPGLTVRLLSCAYSMIYPTTKSPASWDYPFRPPK